MSTHLIIELISITPPLSPQKTAPSSTGFNPSQCFQQNDHPPPGALPVPDWQGPYGICTVHALAKSILFGFWRGKFYFGAAVPVSLNQEAVTSALLQTFQDIAPRHPTDFDQKSYVFQDVNKTLWKTGIRVQKTYIGVELLPWNLRSFEYLITYWYGPQNLHCVVVDHYHLRSDSFFCLNSHGSQLPFPSIPASAVVDMYRVECQAVPLPPLTPAQVSPSRGSSFVPASDVVDMYRVECEPVRQWAPGQISPQVLTPRPSPGSSPSSLHYVRGPAPSPTSLTWSGSCHVSGFPSPSPHSMTPVLPQHLRPSY